MDKKHTHLQMIQGIINRLSNNSFLLKGWSVVLVSAMFALAAKDTNSFFVLLAYFPAISFWGLDGFFLYQERLYRAHYNQVRELSEDEIDYSMDITHVIKDESPWIRVTFSKTLFIFHGVIILIISVVIFLFPLFK